MTPPQTTRSLDHECTRLIARMMDLMPSDFTAVNSTLTAKQFPKRFWKGPDESVWFENQCLGANKLVSMMKELSKAANLDQVYTNLCIR